MSRNNEKLISIIHKMFRKDPYILALFESWGITLDELESKLRLLSQEYLFSTMSNKRIKELEKELAYKTMSNTLEGKRTEIEARWKMSGKCDVELLQTIANSWRNGVIKVSFIDATIEIKFVSLVGIPDDLNTLKFMIDEAKPAHLPINFSLMYRTWGMLPPRTWGQIGAFTWKELREKEGV